MKTLKTLFLIAMIASVAGCSSIKRPDFLSYPKFECKGCRAVEDDKFLKDNLDQLAEDIKNYVVPGNY